MAKQNNLIDAVKKIKNILELNGRIVENLEKRVERLEERISKLEVSSEPITGTIEEY